MAPDASTPTGSQSVGADRTTRQAALWATAVAVPLAVLVAVVSLLQLRPDPPVAAPSPSPTPTSGRSQSTAPVEMQARPLGQRPATVCRALLSQLPAAIRDLPQRPVLAGPEQNAAYGDPALTVACGVPAEQPRATEDVWLVNRVCWRLRTTGEAAVLTTLDREVPVRLTVPQTYEQPLQWAAPVSETLIESVPSRPDVPSGCRAGAAGA